MARAGACAHAALHQSAVALIMALGSGTGMEASWAQDSAPATEPAADLAVIELEPALAAPESPEQVEAGAAAIAEVVVTAQRRSQNLQETPVAVTALGSQELEERNVQSTQDLMQVAPSLQVSTAAGPNGGAAVFFLRGMGQQRSGNGTEPAVGVYVDGVYYPSLQGAIFNMLDIRQVEVLRGPQGTLFGRNTIGGAIRYTSRAPEFDNGGYVQATAGSYDRRDLTGVINLAYDDLAALRLTGGRLHRDGFVRQQDGGEDAGGQDNELIRAQLLVTPMDALKIELMGQRNRSELDGLAYSQPGPIEPRPNTIPWYYNLTALGGLTNPPYDDRFASTCDHCQAGTNVREFADTQSSAAQIGVTWSGLESVEVKSLSAWQRVGSRYALDLDGSPAPVYSASAHTRDEIYSQEFQFSGKALDERLDWVSGLYAARQSFDMLPGTSQLLLGRISDDPDPVERRTHTLAGFVDATYELFEHAQVLGGYRISQDDKEATLHDSGNGELLDHERRKFTSNTGRVGLQYRWTDRIMSYATVSTGFKAGGFNVNVSGPLIFTPGLRRSELGSYKPENVTSYEIGARTEFFGGAIRINPTVFYAQWRDVQVQSVNVNASTLEVYVDNAASAHSQGLELEMQAAVSRQLVFFANGALLRMRYDSVGDASGITKDSRFMRAPKLTYTVGGRYQNSVANWFHYVFSANWNWQDDQASNATDDTSLSLPAYGLLSLRAEVKSINDVLECALFVTNALDETYYVGGTDYTGSAGTRRFDLGRPREAGISLRYNF